MWNKINIFGKSFFFSNTSISNFGNEKNLKRVNIVMEYLLTFHNKNNTIYIMF